MHFSGFQHDEDSGEKHADLMGTSPTNLSRKKSFSFYMNDDTSIYDCRHRMDDSKVSTNGRVQLTSWGMVLTLDSNQKKIIEFSRIQKLRSRKVQHSDGKRDVEVVISCVNPREKNVFHDLTNPDDFMEKIQRQKIAAPNRSEIASNLSSPSGTSNMDKGEAPHFPELIFPDGDPDTLIQQVPLNEPLNETWFSTCDVMRKRVAIANFELPSSVTTLILVHSVIKTSNFINRYHQIRGDTKVSVGALSAESTTFGSRLVTTTTAVNAPWKVITPLQQGQRFACGSRGGNRVILWHLSTQTPKVTAGTSFRIEILFEFVTSGTANSPVSVTVFMNVKFTSNINGFLKGKIEKGAYDELPKSYKQFLDELVSFCAQSGTSAANGIIKNMNSEPKNIALSTPNHHSPKREDSNVQFGILGSTVGTAGLAFGLVVIIFSIGLIFITNASGYESVRFAEFRDQESALFLLRQRALQQKSMTDRRVNIAFWINVLIGCLEIGVITTLCMFA